MIAIGARDARSLTGRFRAGALLRGVRRRVVEPEELREFVELPCGEFLRIHPTESDHIASVKGDGPFVVNR